MNLVYFKFLFATTIKKRPVWITWLLYIFTVTMFMIVMPLVSTINPYQIWANTTMAVCQTFLGMLVAIFTAVLSINIFKDSNEEGTELIIISKPISRRKIVFTKFVVFFVFCLIVNLCAVLITVFTIFVPGSEVQFYWGLVLSMFIGNIVSFGVFGSIAILLTVNFAKVGIIIVNIIISLVFLIYQILTLMVFKTPLRRLVDDSIVAQTVLYAQRNIDKNSDEYGSYKEKDFVMFESSPIILPDEEIMYAISGPDWKSVVDHWEGIKEKDPSKILNITDLAGQVALSYLSVGVNGYSERQAKRMFAISRFWNYKLTSPASPEIIKREDYKTVRADKWDSIPILYSGANNVTYWTYDFIQGDIVEHNIYLPGSYDFVGIREEKPAALAGAMADKIAIGYIRGQKPLEKLFSRKDIYFEQNKWIKYAPAFDQMYGTTLKKPGDEPNSIFDWNLQDKNGDSYYDQSRAPTEPENIVQLWQNDEKNLQKYYHLIWAIFTGKQSEIFGDSEDSPFFGLTRETFDINSPDDLNERFIQFKHYCFYKVWQEQQDLLKHGLTFTNNETTAQAQILGNQETNMELAFMQTMVEPQEESEYTHTWMLKATDDADTSWLCLLSPGTEAPNIHAMIQTKDALENDNDKRYSAYAKYLLQSSIIRSMCWPNEYFLYTDIEQTDRRTEDQMGEAYCTSDTWQPFWTSQLAYILSGFKTYLPTSQNMRFFFYEANKTLDFWVYAVIWTIISAGLFCGGVVVYNKYDVK